MRRALAPALAAGPHRREGQEQEGPPRGYVGERNRDMGCGEVLFLKVGKAGRTVAPTTPGPGDNRPGSEPRMIARQADYTASRPLEFPGEKRRDQPHPLPALPEQH